ncbi:hypothetical protein CDO23_02035 [Sinorhizobium meliloti]|nr:hypothetical protein CDO23_02035 [Sinorhizobium meliloti]
MRHASRSDQAFRLQRPVCRARGSRLYSPPCGGDARQARGGKRATVFNSVSRREAPPCRRPEFHLSA